MFQGGGVRREAALHYLPGASALCDQAGSLAAHLDIPLHVATAVDHLQRVSGISVEQIFHAHVPHRHAKALRYAFYVALANRLYPDTPWLQAPVLTPGLEASTLRSFQTRVAMAPFLGSPWTLLHPCELRPTVQCCLGSS